LEIWVKSEGIGSNIFKTLPGTILGVVHKINSKQTGHNFGFSPTKCEQKFSGFEIVYF
jgi:hypothetical protein